MELIFLYINHSKSGFIDKQGINLNSQYYFEVTYEEEKYILFQKSILVFLMIQIALVM